MLIVRSPSILFLQSPSILFFRSPLDRRWLIATAIIRVRYRVWHWIGRKTLKFNHWIPSDTASATELFTWHCVWQWIWHWIWSDIEFQWLKIVTWTRSVALSLELELSWPNLYSCRACRSISLFSPTAPFIAMRINRSPLNLSEVRLFNRMTSSQTNLETDYFLGGRTGQIGQRQWVDRVPFVATFFRH